MPRPAHPPGPTFRRAVYRAADDRLHVSAYDPTGACRGWFFATGATLPEGVSLASLEIDAVAAEVLVRFQLGTDTPAARERLIRWAAAVGHRRLWFADTLIDLAAEPVPTASVTRCDCCETTFREDAPEFLENVRRHHAYPRACPVCAAPLPVWDSEYLDQEENAR